jgi:hypothetical protein
MPRVKKTGSTKSSSGSKKNKSKSKPKVKASSKKNTKKTKKTANRTNKVKPVIVDVISDENIEEETFFSDKSLSLQDAPIDLKETEKFFLDLEENEASRRHPDLEENKNDDFQNLPEETDKQKQFFSGLVTEMHRQKKTEKGIGESEGKTYKNKKSIRLYRSLAWKFLVLVGFLALVVFYFSFSKLTILITPEVEAMNNTLFLKVANQDEGEVRPGDARDKVSGSVNKLEIEVEKIYQSSGEEFLGEEITGKVRIINNYSRSQPLVATTRLLSPDNKLFRIKEAVNVPAGEEVEVEIYADKITRDMAISPSRFTIPGLWAGLQDKIYAESDQAFSYRQKMQRYIKTSDIQLAKSEAYDLILAKVKEIESFRSQDEMIYKILEPINIEFSAEVGDKKDEFNLKASATVVVISFSQEEVERLALSKLKILVPDDKELIEFNSNSLSYILESYDEEEEIATIKATFSGLMVLKSDANVIKKENLVNLKAEQIDTYLKDYPEINKYELKFYPVFVKRAPHLVDRIEIKIKDSF